VRGGERVAGRETWSKGGWVEGFVSRTILHEKHGQGKEGGKVGLWIRGQRWGDSAPTVAGDEIGRGGLNICYETWLSLLGQASGEFVEWKNAES